MVHTRVRGLGLPPPQPSAASLRQRVEGLREENRRLRRKLAGGPTDSTADSRQTRRRGRLTATQSYDGQH